MSDSPPLDGLRIAIVGAGRLGSALAASLRLAGLRVDGPLPRGTDGRGADVVLLCVPDDAIADAARIVRPGALLGHTSGATTLEPLAPHECFSMHPLLAVSGPDAQFRGSWCAIAGSTERATTVAAALATRLGMRPFVVADADRATYHAAASMASNYLVTLEWAAARLGSRAGLGHEQLAPLARAALESWTQHGARGALTGPIERGDDATVARQRDAVAARAPELLPLWDALAAVTRRLAAEPRRPS